MKANPPRSPGTALVFIGNAVRAAGYRLGGFVTVTPAPGHEAAAVERALQGAGLVVLDADVAERLPAARLDAWLAGGAPPFVVAPRGDGACSRADPAERVRTQLGLDA